ncbi:MAG: amidohydrolase family protein [Acidimicrobiales bacterium]
MTSNVEHRNPSIAEAIESLDLVDHHVHGALKIELDRASFEDVMTESDRAHRPGTSNFDSQVGFAIRRWCAPLLDLDVFADSSAYIERRLALGADEVNRRLLRAAHVGALLVDTGFAAGDLLDLDQMSEASGAPSYEVVRLESVAEDIARNGVSAKDFADTFRATLKERLSSGAVATKSIAAYRYGLNFDPERPSARDVEVATGHWLATIERSGAVRVDDPVLLRFLLWSGVDVELPVQIHTGYGDSDLDLIRSNPAHLTDFLRAVEPIGTPVVLLHCYPYQREAAYLAQMFPNVFFDIGEAINYTGVQSRQLIAESFEIAPFTKQLYSSDAWGLAEFHLLGSRLWRNGLTSLLSQWVDETHWSRADAIRVATLVGRQNAIDLYHLDASL